MKMHLECSVDGRQRSAPEQNFSSCTVVVQEENLSAMNLDPWYSTYHFSHPPLIDRLGAIDSKSKKRL